MIPAQVLLTLRAINGYHQFPDPEGSAETVSLSEEDKSRRRGPPVVRGAQFADRCSIQNSNSVFGLHVIYNF